MRFGPICTLAILLRVAVANASALGIAPPPPPIWHPAQDLPRDEVFDRLDDLTDRLYAQGFATAHEELELAILELCTARPQDRVEALEVLEDLRRREPDRLDVLLWIVTAHHHALDAASAIAPLESARERFEGNAAYHYALGYAHWFDARRHLQPDAIDSALDAFERACELQPSSPVHVAGLAAVCLVTDRPERALPFLPDITAGQAVSMPQLLLTAGLSSYDSRTQEKAENLFGQAFDALPPDLVGDLEHGGGRLPGVAAGDLAAAAAYWRLTDPDPVRTSHAHRLEFWRRHLQADVLWGDPTSDTPGWRTEPGDLWVRWGRPTFTRETTPEVRPFVSVGAAGRSGATEADGEGMGTNLRTWTWTWAGSGPVFSVNFVDTSYQRTWHVPPEAAKSVAALVRDRPVRFERGPTRSPFEIAVETALTRSTRERSSLVTSVAILASDFVESRAVEDLGDVALRWSLFDADERRIEAGDFVVDPSLDRDTLLARTDPRRRASGTKPARALRFGLDLEPGSYRLALEAEDTITGARRWADSRLVIDPRPADAPSMSTLMLGASFDDFDRDAALPASFVRHATTVVPLPERLVPRTQDRLYVYFEVYDLGLEEDGRTRITVSYRVTPSGPEDGVPRIDEFVEERTGLSTDGTLVKGTALDLLRLDPGPHELVVTVVDLVRDVRMEGSLEFVVEDESDTP